MTDSAAGTGALRNLGHVYLKRRYKILFYTLLFTMVVFPLIAGFGLSGTLIESLLAACLLAAVVPLGEGRNRSLLLTFLLLAWLARPVTAWLGHETLSALTLGAWTLIGLFAAAAALRFAMRGVEVNSEHLFAALSGLFAGRYLLWSALLGSSASSPGNVFHTQPFERFGHLF